MTPTMGEWRKVESTVSDGPGQERTETSYVFGAEYEGVFVPAVTKASGYFEHLVQRGRDDAERDQQQQQSDAGQDTTTSQTVGQRIQQSAQQSQQGGSTSGGA